MLEFHSSPTETAPTTAPPSSSGERAALELEAAALSELSTRRARAPLYYFTPSSAHRPFFASRSPIRQLVGANRSGKSEDLVADCSSFALGYRPWILRELDRPCPDPVWIRPSDCPEAALCFSSIGVRLQPPCNILYLTGQPIKVGIGQVAQEKFTKYLAGAIEKPIIGHSNTWSKLILKNGTVIHFASDQQDGVSFEGANYAAVFVDEPIRRSSYVGLRRGCIDQSAPITFAYTPVTANAAWMFSDLYTKADNKRIYALTCSIWQNDYLSREAIEEFANDPAISDAEKEARLHGRFLSLADRVYSDFDQSVHVLQPWNPGDQYSIAHVIDPHSVRPYAQIWAAARSDSLIIFRERPVGDMTKIRKDPRTFAQQAALIRDAEGTNPAISRFCDPNYGPRKDTLRGTQVESVVEALAQYGLQFDARLNDDLAWGEGRVRSLLRYNKNEPLSYANRPRLYITEDCPNTIAALTYYAVKAKTGSDFVEDEKRDERHKDHADCVRYLCVSSFSTTAHYESPYSSLGARALDEYQEPRLTEYEP